MKTFRAYAEELSAVEDSGKPETISFRFNNDGKILMLGLSVNDGVYSIRRIAKDTQVPVRQIDVNAIKKYMKKHYPDLKHGGWFK